ncbi:Uncharacterized protein BM_BM7195 [Brugia malayi]|uniref:Bm7195 n=1 Tax=Brugia malayi TaxID=6279 RepID=A0A0H5S055_BRUMA|nr:Uncharacterized protein BM_BM7195 [Brugia malayi]CRZ22008.1 Bm7195 [Brugia malayi]VIO88276.1 Uncharacterized protein BM_BM7195 [Brugia malayi]
MRRMKSRQLSSKSSDSGSYGRRTRSKSRDRRSSRSRSREDRRSSRSRSRGRRSSRSVSRGRRYSRSKSQDRRYSRSRSRDRRSNRSRSHGRRRSKSSGKRHSRERSQSYLWHNRDRSKSRSSERIGKDKHDKRSTKHRHSKQCSKTSQEKMKNTVKEIEVMKSRMRSALESAQTKMGSVVEARGLLSDSYSSMDLTVMETIARHRDIERIEEEGFHQSSFISSSGGAGGRVRKEDATDRTAMVTKKEDEHDKAMFGPKWRDAEKRYSDEKKEAVGDVEVDKEIPLANARFFEDQIVREERWLKIYRERRAKLLGL